MTQAEQRPVTRSDRLARNTVVLGALAAAAAITAADVANPQFDFIAVTASRYVNGNAGWLIPTALVLISASSALVAWRPAPTRPNRAGIAALLVCAAGFAVAAVFPADPPGQWDRPSTAEMVHGLAGWTAFLAFPIAAVLSARSDRAAAGPRRAVLAATGFSVVTTAVFAVVLVDTMDGPSIRFGSAESLVGLSERLALGADLAWLVVAATAAPTLRRGGAERS
ncbi:DUF998 domain-containing protein [Glycomyces xiaoerkulensis]|uniref:DUF998 domain-containing protein n=1 Tax=Glycomyces xiaoerkulensis TaxID=2038139 RepID=UPI000C264D26|nr:DUF998 domain-containing protein [Glycomyces xiaoerkulensis]